MKKMLLLALAAVGCAVLSTGCISTEANRVGDQISVKMSLKLDPQVDVKSQKVSGSAAVHSVLGFINWGVNSQAVGVNFGTSADFLNIVPNGENVAKNGAVYNACIKNKADLLVAPQYVITKKNFIVYQVIQCQVTGFPGYVKSVKVVK
jgi:hypothetical protein